MLTVEQFVRGVSMDNVEYILTCFKCYCLFYDKDESKFVCANCEEEE